MGGVPWRWLIGAMLAITATAIWISPEPVAERLASAPTSQLLQYLGNDREVVWQAAAEEILNRGAQCVPECAVAITSAAPELRLRLFHVLEQSFLSQDSQTYEFAAEALESLQRGSRLELSLPADRILTENAPLRTSRALLRIEELGGEIRPLAADRIRNSAVPGLILLDDRWRGGDAGLHQITRLRGVSQVHISRDAGVSEAAISGLLKQQPRLYLVRSGQGCLGVEGEASNFGFLVKGIGKNSPAAGCGIALDDEIVGVDDDARSLFAPMPQRVARFAPGSVVRLHVRRGRSRFSVDVQLGGAYGTGVCACGESIDGAGTAAASAELGGPPQEHLVRLTPTPDSGPNPPDMAD